MIQSQPMGIRRSRSTVTAARRQLAASSPSGPVPAGPVAQPSGLAIGSPWADPTGLQVATWAGLLDGLDPDTLAGLPVTRAQAIALPAIARGRDIICQSCAGVDFFAANAAGRLPVQPRPIELPAVGQPRYVTLLWTVDSMYFYGFAAWEVTRRYAEDARPMTFRYVPNAALTVDEAGNITHVSGRPVGPYDVVRFDGPHEGILTRGAETIRDARALRSTFSRSTRTPTPDVELHQEAGEEMTDPEVDAMIARWVAARQGRNGGVAYTNPNVKAIMHGQQPQDLLVEARKAINLDLARIQNLPAWAVDAEVGGSSLTYSNVPSRARELIDYTLSGYLRPIAARLSLDDIRPAGEWVDYSTDVLTNGDFGDRMTAYKDATDAGVYSAQELRNREAGQPLEGPATA